VNLASVIDLHPDDAPALVSGGVVTTYGELRRQVAELRHGLGGIGVGPGDRVALVAANNWFFVVSYLAVLGVGAVAVPLNPGSPNAELARQLDEIGVALVVAAGPGGRLAAGSLDLGAAALVANEAMGLAGATTLESLFTGAVAPVVDREEADLATLLFTAGTAGAPKAAMLTHGNLAANLDQIQRHPGRAVAAGDTCLGVLPLHHIYGLNVVLMLSLLAGSRVVLLDRFDAAAALDTIAEHQVTVVAGVPPMYAAWLNLPTADASALGTVRLAVSGAAPLSVAVARGFRERFGVTIHEGYGLTEASPVVTSSVVGMPVREGSIGLPLPGVEVRLVDVDGADVLAGDPGEIWVRGPNVFAGYWADPAATSATLTADGWLRTGDIAVVDDEGWLSIVDRAKDVIIVSGFNVYPAEVEQALGEHDGVARVAVIGVPDPHTGEAVKAFVVAVPGRQVDQHGLIEFCATRLARYKCPTTVQFVDELPEGVAGKLLRRALRELGAS